MDTSSMPKGIVSDRLAGKNDPGIMKEDKATVTSQLNGRLIRVVKVNDLKGYFNYRSSDTGHIVFTVRDADKLNENHILIIQGKPVAAYSEGSSLCGSALIESLLGVAGTIEYYFIEEPIIRSVLDMHPQIATDAERKPAPEVPAEKKAGPDRLKAPAGAKAAAPADHVSQKPMAFENPRKPQLTKDQANDSAMNEIEDLHAYSVEEGQHGHALEPANQPAPAKKSPEDMVTEEDEVRYMKNVEEEFESNIDSLLNRLKLTHLKMPHDKKKS